LWEFAHLGTGAAPERDPDGKLRILAKSGLVLVLIPGGYFDMGAVRPSEGFPLGAPNVDPGTTVHAGPVHARTVAAFLLSKYEMTQAQWLRFTGENPSHYELGTMERGHAHTLLHPVEQVSWDDGVRVLSRLGLRLPTEAEWEYAARAGTDTIWWTGNDRRSLEGSANLKDSRFVIDEGTPLTHYEAWLDDGYRRHAPVGSYRPNPFGLHDVCGNVREWCRDRWHWEGYEGAPDDGSPWESGSCPERVIRDGGFIGLAGDCRSAARFIGMPGDRHGYIGLRPARSLE
jgi:formylglycine-generating enzyme required for sulfatase activity